MHKNSVRTSTPAPEKSISLHISPDDPQDRIDSITVIGGAESPWPKRYNPVEYTPVPSLNYVAFLLVEFESKDGHHYTRHNIPYHQFIEYDGDTDEQRVQNFMSTGWVSQHFGKNATTKTIKIAANEVINSISGQVHTAHPNYYISTLFKGIFDELKWSSKLKRYSEFYSVSVDRALKMSSVIGYLNITLRNIETNTVRPKEVFLGKPWETGNTLFASYPFSLDCRHDERIGGFDICNLGEIPPLLNELAHDQHHERMEKNISSPEELTLLPLIELGIFTRVIPSKVGG